VPNDPFSSKFWLDLADAGITEREILDSEDASIGCWQALLKKRDNLTPREVDRLYRGSWDYNDILDEQDRQAAMNNDPPVERE
jgi:hypothetical protein